ncbi:MAG: iron chelate uptake ABC transporter family permease subunit [Coriobacteriia bacterium]|nr:iron chelate uptake ABC transporter family permease subunit [Coriobacteriia bacterium]
MASSDNKEASLVSFDASDIARLRNGGAIPSAVSTAQGGVRRLIGMKDTNALYRKEHDKLAMKVAVFVVALVILCFFSLCFTGASGQYYTYCSAYTFYTPLEVANALYYHAYNAIAVSTHWLSAVPNEWLLENVPGYWAIVSRAGVVGITLICSFLLAISGMLYQNAFRNPMAGPGMLGVGSGVSMGMMLLVALYSSAAPAMMQERYLYCYLLGVAILVFVILAGRKLSGPGRPFDIVTMMLIGSVLSQLLGFITMYMTLFVMDESDYLTYYTMSQMLVVDTSAVSWFALGSAMIISFIPIVFLRYKLNVLSFDESEARLLGIEYGRMRAIALICGAIMILAAQIHVGGVGLVSLVVPFLARSFFGCEFNKQLLGNLCISPVLLLVCRDITDAIPFIGDGLALSSTVSVVMVPLFVYVMAKHMRGWE